LLAEGLTMLLQTFYIFISIFPRVAAFRSAVDRHLPGIGVVIGLLVIGLLVIGLLVIGLLVIGLLVIGLF